MSYNGKKPTFSNATIKESISYKNLTSTPSLPLSNYIKFYFKNGIPYYLDAAGVESTFNQSASISIETFDVAIKGEPTFIYSDGLVSFNSMLKKYNLKTENFQNTLIPTNNISQTLEVNKIQPSFFAPNLLTLLSTPSDDVVSYNNQTNLVTELSLNTSVFDGAVHPLDLSFYHIVYFADQKLQYRVLDTNYNPVYSNDTTLGVFNEVSYIKIVPLSLKNDSTSNLVELVIIYVEGNNLRIKTLKYDVDSSVFNEPSYINTLWYKKIWGLFPPTQEFTISDEYQFSYLDATWLDLMWSGWGPAPYNRILPPIQVLDDITIPTSMLDKTVKHVHLYHDADNLYTYIEPLVESATDIIGYNCKAPNLATPSERLIEYVTSNSYNPNMDVVGSLTYQTGVSGLYYSIGNTVYTPAGSYDLSSEGILITITRNHAKTDTISAIFVDRTVEITVLESNGEFTQYKKTMNNDFVLPSGTDYYALGIYEDILDQSINGLKTLIMYKDVNNDFSTIKANIVDDIIEVKPTLNSIQLLDSNTTRFIKPFSLENFIISYEENNKLKEYNYTTDTFTQYNITVQGETTGILAAALPISSDRIVTVNQDKNSATGIHVEVRIIDGVPYTTIGANTFALGVTAVINEIILLEDLKFAVQVGEDSVVGFSWDESLLQPSKDWQLNKVDFSGDDIKFIAPGLNDKLAVLTVNSTSDVATVHTIESGVITVSIILGSYPLNGYTLFSYNEGIIAASVSTTSDKNIIILDNDLNIVFTSSDNIFDENLLNQNGFNVSNLKHTINNSSYFNLNYNNYLQRTYFKSIGDLSSLGTGQGNKQDCPVLPVSNIKPETMVSRWVYQSALDSSNGNLLIDYFKDSTNISESTGTTADITDTEVKLYSLQSKDDDDTYFTYVTPDKELYNKLITNGSVSSTTLIDTFTNEPLELETVYTNNRLIYAVSDGLGITLIGNNTVTVSEFNSNIKLLSFGSSLQLFYMNGSSLVVKSMLVDNSGNITIENTNTITDVARYELGSLLYSESTIFVEKTSSKELILFKVDESSFTILDIVSVSINTKVNVLSDFGYGLLADDNIKQFYKIDGGIILLNQIENDLIIEDITPITNSFFVYSYNNIVYIAEITNNRIFVRDSIIFKDNFNVKDISFANNSLHVLSEKDNWYVSEYELQFNSEIGTYIGVSQNDVEGTERATIVLKGGISTVHQRLKPNTEVVSGSGVTLGTAISRNNILLYNQNIEEVIKPTNITPSNGGIELGKPSNLVGSVYVNSLYGRPAALRRFRVSTDKKFSKIVYEGVENPYNASHALTDDSWIEENVVYYWQIQDENDLGYTSDWSNATIFSVSLVSNVEVPNIVSPTNNAVDLSLTPTIELSAFKAVPTETHVSSSYEIYQVTEEGLTLVHQNLNDGSNLITYTIPSGVLEYSSFYAVRGRQEGNVTGNSTWSDFIYFDTEEIDGILAVGHRNIPYISFYAQDLESFSKIDDPDTIPTGSVTGVELSTDLAVLSLNSSPYIYVYRREGKIFTKLNDPSTLPDGPATRIALYGDYIAVSHDVAPYLTLYRIDGDKIIKIDDPSLVPSGKSTDVRFSKDGNYLAVATVDTPYFIIYKRVVDTFTKLDNPAVSPSGQVNSISMYNGKIVLGLESAPYVEFYKNDSDVLTKLTTPSHTPTGPVTGVDISINNLVAISHINYPNLTTYEISSDSLVKSGVVGVLPSSDGNSSNFSADGLFLTVTQKASPYIAIYKVGGTTYSRLADPDTLPSGEGLSSKQITL